MSRLNHWAAIGLGSNLGDRAAHLLSAITQLIEAGIKVVRISAIYETDPVDYLAQPAFLNMVILVEGVDLPSPQALLTLCLQIENRLKRERLIDKGPRTIDLDLLLYDDLVLAESTTPLLNLPHPRLHERLFVLVPLVELIGDYQHPVLGLSYRQLLAQLAVSDKVELYGKGF